LLYRIFVFDLANTPRLAIIFELDCTSFRRDTDELIACVPIERPDAI
jgi:hypothetical protein